MDRTEARAAMMYHYFIKHFPSGSELSIETVMEVVYKLETKIAELTDDKEVSNKLIESWIEGAAKMGADNLSLRNQVAVLREAAGKVVRLSTSSKRESAMNGAEFYAAFKDALEYVQVQFRNMEQVTVTINTCEIVISANGRVAAITVPKVY